MNKSSINNVKTELKPNSEQKPIVTTSSQTIANALVGGSVVNIHNEVKKYCPKDANVYFNQSQQTITVILDKDIGRDKRSSMQTKILSFLGRRMLHDTYRTVKVMW